MDDDCALIPLLGVVDSVFVLLYTVVFWYEPIKFTSVKLPATTTLPPGAIVKPSIQAFWAVLPTANLCVELKEEG